MKTLLRILTALLALVLVVTVGGASLGMVELAVVLALFTVAVVGITRLRRWGRQLHPST